MEYLMAIPIVFIFGVYFVSMYNYYKEEKRKIAKRKCRLDKYNK